MKKNLLLAIVCLNFTVFSFAQNNGAGCRKAIVALPGNFVVDSLFKGVASYPNDFPYPDRAIWYKYTPTTDGLMTISSCGGGSDTRLFLYTGTCDTLTLSGYNDDFCLYDPTSSDELAANITKPVKANKTYFFEWDNAWDLTAHFTFTLSLSAFTPRATQTCETATTISLGTINVDSLFGYASRGDASRSNWYKYTPVKNGKISINSCGQDVDTRLWMYRGICSSLTLVNSSDDDCASSAGDLIAASIVDQSVTAGTTYYFEWDDSYENTPFSFILTFDAANGVEEERLAQSIAMSPNPTSQVLNLDMNFDKTTDLSVHIFNNIGQTVLSKKIDDILRGAQTLDVSRLKTGIYIVEFSNGLTHTNKKLVISR